MCKLRKKITIYLLGSLFKLMFSTYALILECPVIVDEEYLRQKILTSSLSMKWITDLQNKKTLISIAFERLKNDKTSLTIEIEGDFPSDLEKYKNQFQFKGHNDHNKWLFSSGSFMQSDTVEIPSNLPLESLDIIHQPREFSHLHITKLNIAEMAKLIANQKCIFYTGAGISAEVVSTMSKLMKDLGLEQKNNIIQIIDGILKNPHKFRDIMEKFYKACLYGEPTQAHFSLKAIALQKKWGLITENLDLLHQRSGIKPLTRENGNWIRKNVQIEDLKKIDCIITIGLAQDESGFLGWYKNHNPNGKIMAINLEAPPYLDESDYFIEGNIQELLPKFQQELGM